MLEDRIKSTVEAFATVQREILKLVLDHTSKAEPGDLKRVQILCNRLTIIVNAVETLDDVLGEWLSDAIRDRERLTAKPPQTAKNK